MKKLITSALVLCGLSASAANIDYRALLLQYFTTNNFYVGLNTNGVVTFGSVNTNFFTTNGFILSLNTNAGSLTYNLVTNLISIFGGGGANLWASNAVEGGIWWSNQNGNAKFGPLAAGTFVSGYTNSAGSIIADAKGAVALGEAFGASALIYADGEGSLAGGEAQAGGTITTVELGGFAWGHANGANSKINASDVGTFALGNALTGGTIQATVAGAVAMGDARAGGRILSDGTAALSVGQALGATGVLDSFGNGTLAQGQADNGVIQARDVGSMASGAASTNAILQSGGKGSHVFGNAAKGSSNVTYSTAGFVSGHSQSNSVLMAGGTTGGGSGYEHLADTVFGAAVGTTLGIKADGGGAFAGGVSTNGWLTATGRAAFTYGRDIVNESAGGGSFAFGRDFTNRTAETFNVGWGSNVFTVNPTGMVVNGTATINGTGGANFMDSLNVSSNLFLTNLTASTMVFADSNKKLTSSAASGAVPIDADGSASTAAQINALFPSYLVTNNNANAQMASNNITVDYTHQFNGNGVGLTNVWIKQVILFGYGAAVPNGGSRYMTPSGVNAGGSFSSTAAPALGLCPSGGYLSNLTWFTMTQMLSTTNASLTFQTNVTSNVVTVDTGFTSTMLGATAVNNTNSGTTSFICPTTPTFLNIRYSSTAALPNQTISGSYEWWHQSP